MSHIQALEIHAKQQDQEIQVLRNETANRDAQIMALVNKARHIETGSIECGGLYKNSKPVSQNFNTPYDQPPIVYLSTFTFDLEGVESKYSADHQVDMTLDSVSKTGFSATCIAMNDADRINRNTINWISFAK